jgi:hypothetical protein
MEPIKLWFAIVEIALMLIISGWLAFLLIDRR